MRVAVAALEQLGDRAEGVVAAQSDDEPDRLAVAPCGGPPSRLEDGHHLLGVQDRLAVEHSRAPSLVDGRMKGHGGIRVLLDHILTLPAE